VALVFAASLVGAFCATLGKEKATIKTHMSSRRIR